MIRHLLFDLDGTLSDSREGIRNSVAHALRRLGLPDPPRETIEAWIGPPLQDSFATYLRTVDAGRIDEALRLFREYYAARGVRECTAYPGIPEALETLRSSGHDLYLATAKPTGYAREVLRHLGIGAPFGTGPRSPSMAGPTSDPAPGARRAPPPGSFRPRVYGSPATGGNTPKSEIVRRILEAHAIDPADALMIGDRIHDIEGARANGVRAVAVTWGYAAEGELVAAAPRFTADHPGRIPEIAGRG